MAMKRKAASALIVSVLLSDDEEKDTKHRRRKFWVKPWLARRKSQGASDNLINELKLEDKNSYRRYLRMDEDAFVTLLGKVKIYIEKNDTVMRESISTEERLNVTLRFLASGESFTSLHFQFRLGISTIHGIVNETCKALYESLRVDYIKTPASPSDWLKVAERFEEQWQHPRCIGALDGKHISIYPPPNSGSFYYNYKGDFSLVLLALVDADLKAIFLDVGTNGRAHDTAVFTKSRLGMMLENNAMNLPKAKALPGQTKPTNYVIVGDEGFPMKPYLIRPYALREISYENSIHNKRHSRARRVSENFFGILSNRFRIFLKPIQALPENVVTIVLAACALHNFLRTNVTNYSKNVNYEIVSNKTLLPLTKFGANSTVEAQETRENLKKYFLGEGALENQENFAKV